MSSGPAVVEAGTVSTRPGGVVLEVSDDHGDRFDVGCPQCSRDRRGGHLVTSSTRRKVVERGASVVTERDVRTVATRLRTPGRCSDVGRSGRTDCDAGRTNRLSIVEHRDRDSRHRPFARHGEITDQDKDTAAHATIVVAP